MLRPRLAMAAVLGLVVAVTGACGSNSNSKSSGGKIHLTYAMWDTPEKDGYQKSIDQFEKTHPNITVSIQTFAYNDYQPKLTTEFSSGGGPDIYWVNTPMIAEWIKDGVMADLTDKINAAHIDLSQYLQPLIDLHKYNGKLYGLPKDWDTIAVYYNVDYFAKHHIAVPTSWSWNTTDGGSFLKTLQDLPFNLCGRSGRGSPILRGVTVA